MEWKKRLRENKWFSLTGFQCRHHETELGELGTMSTRKKVVYPEPC
jgi:hypothetical protein